MAKFESKFGLGDHVYVAYKPEDVSAVVWQDNSGRPLPRNGYFEVYEHTVVEVQFSNCVCCGVWYQLRGADDPVRESEVYTTPEEAVEGCRKAEIRENEYYLAQEKKSKNPRKGFAEMASSEIENLKKHNGSYMLYRLRKDGKDYKKGVYVDATRNS